MKCVAFVVVALLLAGCSGQWQNGQPLFDFGDDSAPTPAPAPTAPDMPLPAPPSAAETFCSGFAQDQARNAAERGATTEMQASEVKAQFEQCMATSPHWLDGERN